MQNIDPIQFELSPKTVLQQISTNHIAIVKIIKSRIIMKDGENILEMAHKIWEKKPGVTLTLRTTAPVCSKTEAFLKDHGITVEQSIF
jgi:hypothetical protein